MIIAQQTYGDMLRFNPHFHAIVLEGSFDEKGRLREEEKPTIGPEFEEITEGEEEPEKQKLRTKWTALEGMVGTEKRIALAAKDLVTMFHGFVYASLLKAEPAKGIAGIAGRGLTRGRRHFGCGRIKETGYLDSLG